MKLRFVLALMLMTGLGCNADAATVEMEVQAPTQFKGTGCVLDPAQGSVAEVGIFEMNVFAQTDAGDTVHVAGPFTDPMPGQWYPFTWTPPSGQGTWDFFGSVVTMTGESNGDVCPITPFAFEYDTRIPGDPVIRLRGN